jgi:hypothetical protein
LLGRPAGYLLGLSAADVCVGWEELASGEKQNGGSSGVGTYRGNLVEIIKRKTFHLWKMNSSFSHFGLFFGNLLKNSTLIE